MTRLDPPAEDAGQGDATDDELTPQPFGPLVGPLFWVVIALSVACIAAAALIGLAGPRLFPIRSAPPSPAVRPWQAPPRPLNTAT